MKKKISLFVVTVLSAFCLFGCGSTEPVSYNAETLEATADTIINNFMQMDDASFDNFLTGSDYQVNYVLLQSGLPIEAEAFKGMILSWQAATAECGTFIERDAYTFEESRTEIKMTADVIYSEKNATILFVFDEHLNLESMTVDASYSTGEILKRAGLNTVLGMGTVFAVLIFISFIISLFAYIPALEAKFKKKKDGKTVEEVAVVEPAMEPVISETDDLELIAVITAAIAASEGTGTDGFVVRSIKRRKSNKWSA